MVHMGTEIVVQFGQLDGKGNILPVQPLRVRIQDLTGDDFSKAFSAICRHRIALEEEENRISKAAAEASGGA